MSQIQQMYKTPEKKLIVLPRFYFNKDHTLHIKMNSCIICKDHEKKQPSSCLEKLCCSKSIANEEINKLKCCKQYFHLSCLKTVILVQRDANPSYKYSDGDKCIHCQQHLKENINLTFCTIQEHKNKQKKKLKLRYNRCYWFFIIIIFIITAAISMSLQITKATPKYIQLCEENNLTIISKKEHYNQSYLCERCLSNPENTDKNDGIVCPFPMNGNIGSLITNGFLIVLVALFASEAAQWLDKDILLVFMTFITSVRIITMSLFYTITLESVNHIDNFDQLYHLFLKNMFMDIFVGCLIGIIPILGYLICCCGMCCKYYYFNYFNYFNYFKDCFNHCFHSSHYTQNPIENLSVDNNHTNSKYYKTP
jgi:hypothetical protein